jgi:hypothetical protein
MGNSKQTETKSRRWFLSGGLTEKKTEEQVKMLTPDGKLVTINKSVLDKVSNGKKASNKEVYDWMNNPSKNDL